MVEETAKNYAKYINELNFSKEVKLQRVFFFQNVIIWNENFIQIISDKSNMYEYRWDFN